MVQKQPPRQLSKLSVLFFQEQPFYNFPGGFFCSSNRPYYLIEQILILPEIIICSLNTYEFSRSLYFLIYQIFIFQEALCLLPGRYPRRTDICVNSSRWCFWWFCELNQLLKIMHIFVFSFVVSGSSCGRWFRGGNLTQILKLKDKAFFLLYTKVCLFCDFYSSLI